MKFLFLLIISLLQVIVVYSFPYILLDDEKDNDDIINPSFLEIFEDSAHAYSIADISAPYFNSRFYTNKKRLSGIRNAKIAYWVRFRLKYPKSNDKRWLLEVLDLHVGQIRVYIKTKDDLVALGKSGYKLPFTQRDYLHKNFVFDIPQIAPDEEFSIYIRFQSDTFNPFLLKLRTQNFFLYYALNEYYILGLYYGVLLIMAIYNIMLFFYIREKMYLYYVMYVLSCILVSFSEDGLGFQFIWQHYPSFNAWVEDFAYFVFLFFFTLYAQTFLDFKKHLPRLNYLLWFILTIYALYFSVTYIFELHNPANFNLLLLPFLLIYIGSFQIYQKESISYSQFFIMGYTVTMLGIISANFRKMGIFASDSVIYVYILNIGLMVEIIFFSLALAYRLRVIKLENEQAQTLLIKQLQENEKLIIQKVIERTQEIAYQKTEITEKNLQLEAQAEILRQQAEEIKRMNLILNQENEALQSSVKELTKARVLMQEVDLVDFSKIFPDEDACYHYLADLKWKDGYHCIKCDNDKYTEGQGHSARRCSKCGYNESCTVNTIFHRNHIPIQKAFYLLFLVYANQGKITVVELSEILSLRENTCGKFNKKIKDKINHLSNSTNPRNLDGWSQLILD